MNDGRCNALPRVRAKSLLRRGFGKQTFTGPDISGWFRRKIKASVKSRLPRAPRRIVSCNVFINFNPVTTIRLDSIAERMLFTKWYN
jgi:hypothetical protein